MKDIKELVFFYSLFCLAILAVIDKKPEIVIKMETGEAYKQELPMLFKTYQHATITNFTYQITLGSYRLC